MKTIQFPDEVKFAPETPGVYLYKNNEGKIIYIGKAKNLRNRLKSYLALSLHPKTARMVSEAKTIGLIEVESEFEALLLEARLVRLHMPLFNIELKDDKSPLYIGITKEEFPRVLTLRQTQLPEVKLKYTFGPFVDGASAKYVLRRLRSVFPFSTHKIGKRACIYQEIGLCDPCPSAIVHTQDLALKKELTAKYRKNLRRLVSVLKGKSRAIKKELVREMEELSKSENFEEAQKVKTHITRLGHTLGITVKTNEYMRDPNLLEDIHERELKELKFFIEKHEPVVMLGRIECYDIAHLAGTHPTASMVTFVDGEPNKKYYRHFKINKGKNQNSDVDSMKEVLKRRLKHLEDWGRPDLMIIDGGKPQIAAAKEIVSDIPIVGLAKKYETLVFFENNKFNEFLLPDGLAKNLVVRMRNEAHRFARRLHHNLVTKTLLGK